MKLTTLFLQVLILAASVFALKAILFPGAPKVDSVRVFLLLAATLVFSSNIAMLGLAAIVFGKADDESDDES